MSLDPTTKRRWHFPLLLLGLILPQIILLWPSLSGSCYLLPLNLLCDKRNYLPQSQTQLDTHEIDRSLLDVVVAIEPFRFFAAHEVRAGRWPLWNPYTFCGAPFLANGQSAVFSPWNLPGYLWPSPSILAWLQVLKSLVAGLGMYVFLRRCLCLSYWPGALAAWAFPLSGFVMLWYAFPNSNVVAWLPWLLWAVDCTVKNPRGLGAIALAIFTSLALLSGHAATAGQILLGTGLFALWRLVDVHFCAPSPWSVRLRKTFVAGLVLSLGWGLGFLLSSPQLLPMAEYLRESYRLQMRATGSLETPPTGWSAIPQMLVPGFYGTNHSDSIWIANHSDAWVESPATAYAGMVLALVLLPLACSDKPRRSAVIFWMLLGFFASAYTFNIPGLVEVFKHPPLSLFRSNRLVILTSFSILVLGAVGFEMLCRMERIALRPMILLLLLLLAMAVLCMYRSIVPLDALRPFVNRYGTEELLRGFTVTYVLAACWCLAAMALLLFSWLSKSNKVIRIALPVLILAELFTFASMVYYQNDRSLYYPNLRVFDAMRSLGPGRFCGLNVCPPNVSMMQQLSDIRGYDAVDPHRIVELCKLFEHPQTVHAAYTQMQWTVPTRVNSPLTNMLNLRYLLGRDEPPLNFQPKWRDADYWILENPNALPRVFVPVSAEIVNDSAQRLARLGDPQFDARKIALVESDEPISFTAVEGQGQITSELPCEIHIQLNMQTPGMVVIADRFDQGWKAFINGKAVRVYQVNHALRGVIAPAGESVLEYRYEPASFFLGLRLASAAVIVLVLWSALAFWLARRIPAAAV